MKPLRSRGGEREVMIAKTRMSWLARWNCFTGSWLFFIEISHYSMGQPVF